MLYNSDRISCYVICMQFFSDKGSTSKFVHKSGKATGTFQIQRFTLNIVCTQFLRKKACMPLSRTLSVCRCTCTIFVFLFSRRWRIWMFFFFGRIYHILILNPWVKQTEWRLWKGYINHFLWKVSEWMFILSTLTVAYEYHISCRCYNTSKLNISYFVDSMLEY